MISHKKILSITKMLCLLTSFFPLTTTEQPFDPNHLSRLSLDPGLKVVFVPGPTASRAGGGDRGLWSRLEAPTGIKGTPFVGWCLQPRQMSLAPLSSPPSPCLSHSAHLFLLFLAWVRGVLAHLLPIHPSALKVWDLFLSSFIVCIAHFIF